ncbi:ABC transporter permease subunit [Vibrio rarus]|uniref:ABC transporter permease subunit n=1 Tax=Vibrio rarus TaxID=413403 RepID=UPI0021C4AE88|nr:ABC transporter permease subunit [Vibrio rarus]
MNKAPSLLKETNKSRLVKDKLIAGLIRASGLGMLVGLFGILIYFITEALPVFSPSSYQQSDYQLPVDGRTLQHFHIDNSADNAIAINRSGEVLYFSIAGQVKLLQKTVIQENPAAIAMNSRKPWVAMLDNKGGLDVVLPEFKTSQPHSGKHTEPKLVVDKSLSNLRFITPNFEAKYLGFTLLSEGAVIARANRHAVEILDYVQSESAKAVTNITRLPHRFDNLSGIFITNNGLHVVVLDGKQNWLFSRHTTNDAFSLAYRHIETVPNDFQREFAFINGDKGAIVSSPSHEVEFWFLAFHNEKRLRSERTYPIGSKVLDILPEHTNKGFWAMGGDGSFKLFYATRTKPVLSIDPHPIPLLSTLSANDRYLVSVYQDKLVKFAINAPHPEISLKELTQKVQYEGYSEPDYVWQTSASAEEVEPKFSLVPLVFGTLKAAFYAMLFSVPIAVLGAVYTANFMSTRMRNTIKPAIELMEALPTLVIGFLAATWLAPIMEKNLLAFMLSIVVIPLTALACGGIWAVLPVRVKTQVPKGLHLVTLLPAIVLIWWILFQVSPYIEKFFFDDGLLYFLAKNGWDYQQRNTLIVGIAMGFAVIPTIFTIAEDAIFSVPKHLSNGALALGATEWQTLTRVVLLTASPGIISAIMLGLGRAMGETMIVLTVTGNTPITDWNVFEGLRSLTATIATELPESKVGSSHYRLLFLSALILFLFTFIVNSVGESVRQRLRDKYRSL